MKKIMLAITLTLNGIIIFYACKKDKEPVDFDSQTSQDNALAEGSYNDVNNIIIQALENGSVSTYRTDPSQNTTLSNCASVTINPDSVGNGGNAIIDFGPTNCQCTGAGCSDHRYRRGRILVSYTGLYRDSGTVITTTFDNYYVGKDTTYMFKVDGTKTVTNNGTNSSGNLSYTIDVAGQLTNIAGAVMPWNSTRTREWISGSSTPLNWLDDEYVITGSASGTNFEGNSFTVNITSGLHIQLICPYITEGVFELTPSGRATRTFDYGDGTCDGLATLTVNGSSFQIYLR